MSAWVKSGLRALAWIMSALPPKADIVRLPRHVCFVPCVDGSELARLFFTFAGWSVQPCVRPVRAVHMTAGHNAFRGSGPGQKPAFEMHWHKWVVLIAGSTGSALRAVRPPNLHITPSRCDLIRPLTRPGSCTASCGRSSELGSCGIRGG